MAKMPGVDEKQRLHAAEWAPGDQRGRLVAGAQPLGAGVGARAVVLVEGISDQVALETLAQRRGRDLAAEGVSVIPIGGAQAIGRFLTLLGPEL